MARNEFAETGKIVNEAIKLKREDRLKEAKNLLEAGLEKFPGNNYLQVSLADLFFRLRELDQALDLTERVLLKKPGDPRALTVKGNIAFFKRNYEQALEFFEQASVNDKGPYVASRIIKTYIKLGKYEEARDLCQEWLEKEPDNTAFKKLLAAVYEKMGDRKKAREYYDDYLTQKPQDEFAYKEKIKLKIKDKSAAEAVRELKQMLKVGKRKDNIYLHHLLADRLEKLERYQEALEEYQKTLELEPGNEFATKQAGFCLYRMEEYEQALTYLKEAFRKDPGDYFIRSTLVAIYKKLERAAEGIEFFKGVIRDNPGFKKLWGTVRKLGKEAGEKDED